MDREVRTTYIVIGIGRYECEKCGFKASIEGMLTDWNYCPKCGGKIDSWQE